MMCIYMYIYLLLLGVLSYISNIVHCIFVMLLETQSAGYKFLVYDHALIFNLEINGVRQEKT